VLPVRPAPGNPSWQSSLYGRLPGTSIVSLDSYYRGMEEIPLEERKKVNFDHPDSLDWELLHQHLQAIAAGRAFDEPVYSFADYARTTETRRIEPTEFLIVEGLFVLYWPELRAMLDTKVYVQTDPGVCFNRRLTRDVAERGRTPESVREQYERTVLPSAEWFVYPTDENTPTWWSRAKSRSRRACRLPARPPRRPRPRVRCR
jgi:uridine kinase